MATSISAMSVDEFVHRHFSDYPTDLGYLHAHYARFKRTLELADSKSKPSGIVLDVGAHWLHQALMWKDNGYKVIAADLPATLSLSHVQALARENDIGLVIYDKLESERVFHDIPDNSIDIVLFSEIIEHITFNPVLMWQEVYRVMAPGSKVVVTTPNYYWARGRAWDLTRLSRRLGGGISVDEILQIPTYGPHWKEYSLRELIRYFNVLSDDFVITKGEYVMDPRGLPIPSSLGGRIARMLETAHRVFRWGLHVEATLNKKESGIKVNPSW